MVNVIPSVPRLRSLLALLCCLHVASACLQCDRKVREVIDEYIEKDPELGPGVRDNAYKVYRAKAKETSDGLIDLTTLYRAKTRFLNAFNSFNRSDDKTQVKFIMMISGEGGRILEDELKRFVSEEVCPNKCGLLHRKLKNCMKKDENSKDDTCPNEDKDCSKHLDCGERVVRATEEDHVVLDCFLPWHGLVSGKKEYRYSWASGTHAPADADFTPLLVTEESGLVLNQLRADQWGTYRCALLDRRDGTLISRTTFRLHVDPVPAQTLGPVLTLPTLPAPTASKPLLHTVCVVLTALCLTASVAVTVLLGTMMRRHARRLAGGD